MPHQQKDVSNTQIEFKVDLVFSSSLKDQKDKKNL